MIDELQILIAGLSDPVSGFGSIYGFERYSLLSSYTGDKYTFSDHLQNNLTIARVSLRRNPHTGEAFLIFSSLSFCFAFLKDSQEMANGLRKLQPWNPNGAGGHDARPLGNQFGIVQDARQPTTVTTPQGKGK